MTTTNDLKREALESAEKAICEAEMGTRDRVRYHAAAILRARADEADYHAMYRLTYDERRDRADALRTAANEIERGE